MQLVHGPPSHPYHRTEMSHYPSGPGPNFPPGGGGPNYPSGPYPSGGPNNYPSGLGGGPPGQGYGRSFPSNMPSPPRGPMPMPPHGGAPPGLRSLEAGSGAELPGPLERAIARAHTTVQAQAGIGGGQGYGRFPNMPSPPRGPNVREPMPMPPRQVQGSSSSPKASKPRYKKRTKKYNNFNIFFMLERQLLLQSRGGGIDAVANPIDTSDSPMTKYKELHLPPLCRRYNHLPLTSNWFLELLASQNKKRPHRKSHGLIPFKELAQTVAKNYREIDDETQSFVNEVAERLGWHCEEIERMEEKERKKEGKGSRDSAGEGGKKKNAPVVSVGGEKKVGEGDVTAVQQLMGMKSNSPPLGHQGPMPGPHGMMPPHPSMQGMPPLPHPNAVPSSHFPGAHGHGGPPQGQGRDIEADRLQLELASAMNARLESERRIHMLKEQMTVHQAKKSGGSMQGGAMPPPGYPGRSGGYPSPSGMPSGPYPPPPPSSSGSSYEQYLSMLAADKVAAERERERVVDKLVAERVAERANAERAMVDEAVAKRADEILAAEKAADEIMNAERAKKKSGSNPGSPAAKRPLPSTIAGMSPDATIEDVERALLKEALLRGMIPSPAPNAGPPPRPVSAPGGNRTPSLEALEALWNNPAGMPLAGSSNDEPLKKRSRFSEDAKEGDKSESKEGEAESKPSDAGGRPRSGSHGDIGFYKDLYSKLVRDPAGASSSSRDPLASMSRDALAREVLGRDLGRDPLAAIAAARAAREAETSRDPVAAAAASRDLALFDSLVARGGALDGSSAASRERDALVDSLLASRSRPSSGFDPRYPQSSSRYPPSGSSGLGGSRYEELLSQLAARHASGRDSTQSPALTAAAREAAAREVARVSSASPPKNAPKAGLLEAVHAADRNSKFGLSYSDIMDVWKQMNRERAGSAAPAEGGDKKEGGDEEAKKD